MMAKPIPTAAYTAPRIGLMLAGGGARAAYQVGVLKAILTDQANKALVDMRINHAT